MHTAIEQELGGRIVASNETDSNTTESEDDYSNTASGDDYY
jgi:hypothetical protein